MNAGDAQGASLALLNQGSGGIGAELRAALEALGARIAYESALQELDRSALKACGARVVVINLAPGEDVPDAVVDWLDAEHYEIVINDSETSARLEGFDLARFARHLAAKILHRPDIILPPRPPGAVAPPTFQQHWADRVPEADVPGAPAPARRPAPPPAVPPPASASVAVAPPPEPTDTAGAAESGDPNSIDAQLEQALRSLEASSKAHVPTEEVPDLDVLLASAPRVEEEEAAPEPKRVEPPASPRAVAEPAKIEPAKSTVSAPEWSLEPVEDAERAPAATPAPARQKTSEFGFETMPQHDSLAPQVDASAEPDEFLKAASSGSKLEMIPADVYLSPEVDAAVAAAKPATLKPPVLSTLELVPLDDEVPEDPKNLKK